MGQAWDNFVALLGTPLQVVGLGDVGLGPFNDQTVAHEPAWNVAPVPPNSDMTDADIRAWNLQNKDAFAKDGVQISADGVASAIPGFDFANMKGAVHSSAADVFIQGVTSPVSSVANTFGIGGGGSVFGGSGNTLQTIFIGAAILLGLILVIELVKR